MVQAALRTVRLKDLVSFRVPDQYGWLDYIGWLASDREVYLTGVDGVEHRVLWSDLVGRDFTVTFKVSITCARVHSYELLKLAHLAAGGVTTGGYIDNVRMTVSREAGNSGYVNLWNVKYWVREAVPSETCGQCLREQASSNRWMDEAKRLLITDLDEYKARLPGIEGSLHNVNNNNRNCTLCKP